MIKSVEEKSGGIAIDLTGPQGNAFSLMSYAKSLSKQLNKDWESIRLEMMSGDYEHLLEVFEDNFGSFVTLYR